MATRIKLEHERTIQDALGILRRRPETVTILHDLDRCSLGFRLELQRQLALFLETGDVNAYMSMRQPGG